MYGKKPKNCDCIGDCVDSDNVRYTGPNLPNSGIQTGTILTEVIERIDNYSTSGTSGSSGTSGIDGTSGTSGKHGTSGSSGSSGTTGTSGSSGTSGITGTSGTSGITGTSGTSGSTGTSGSSGTAGTNGTGYNPNELVIETAINYSLTNVDSGKIIIFTSSATLTIPTGLIDGFECTFVTLTGATLTVVSTGNTLYNNEGFVMLPKLTFTLKRRLVVNTFIVTGNM